MLLSLITLTGFFLRIRIILTDELWLDEAITGIFTQLKLNNFIYQLGKEVHPPLFNVLMRTWAVFTGSNDFSLRFLPALFGTALVSLVYKITEKYFDRKSALLASFLIAINPFLIGYSVEARGYTLYAFTATLTFYFLISKRKRLFILSLVILALSHYIAVFYIFLFMLFYLFDQKKNGVGIKKSMFSLTLPMAVVVFLILHAKTGGAPNLLNLEWIKKPNIFNIERSITAYSYGIKTRLAGNDELNTLNLPITSQTLGYVIFLLYVLGILFYLVGNKPNKGDKLKVFTMLTMIISPQVALIILGTITKYTIYVERYLIPSSVFFVILISFILTKLIKIKYIVPALILYIFTLTRIQHPDYYYGMRELSRTLMDSNSEVALTSPTDFLVARYYFGEKNLYRLKLLDPKDPDEDFSWWPLTLKDNKPKNLRNTLFISPDKNRMTEEYIQINSFGSYKVYKKV